MTGLELLDSVREDLQRVEEALYQVVDTPHAQLHDSSTHLLRGGGKRLRPAFALLCGRLFDYSLPRVLPLAVALELIHMATLVHDDVVDEAVLRRGLPTVRARWGDQVSLFAGDYLFAKSLLLVSGYEEMRVAGVLAEVSVRMCQGEIQQMATVHDASQTVRDYLYRIRCKTALLISASCRLGAFVCGAPPAAERALARYGYFLGMAFQITDDILDMEADQAVLGKPVGSDLQQGILTLPAILGMRHPQWGRELRVRFARPMSRTEVEESIMLLRSAGALAEARELSARYIRRAERELDVLPPGKGRDTLAEVARFTALRKF